MLQKKWVLIFLLTYSSCIIYGQDSDFQTWYNIEVDGNIRKLFDYSVSPEIRMWDNSSRIETMLCEISLSKPITKYFSLGVLYRPELVVADIYNHKVNRFSAFADASYKIKRLKFSYRGMYEQQYVDYNTSENGHNPYIWHRHKIGLKYNPRKWDFSPFISTEGFFALRPLKDAQKWKLRTSFGLEYKINKKMNCSVAYKIQKEYNSNHPTTLYILNFGLEYDL
jgi:hypothetical protein